MWWTKDKQSERAGTGSQTRASQRPTMASTPLMRALEPRIMFDAAVAGTAVHEIAAHTEHGAPTHQEAQVEPRHGTAVNDIAATQAPTRKEVVFVDTRAPDYQTLLQGIAPGAEVILLSTSKDGVQQIADSLAGRQDIDAIHIISHGDSGVLLLGNGPLFEGNLAQYSTQLSGIGKALSPDGDILLYGCDVGAGREGQAFVSRLAGLTGADIAASDDNTGASAKGGDWDLEITTGQIAASNALNLSRLGSYDHLLVTTSVSTVAQLKSAIATGVSDNVDDVITLTSNITFASFNDAITINVTDGHTLQIVGGGSRWTVPTRPGCWT